MEQTHESYMARAIQLAEKGRYFTSPNPRVGAVIVYNNQIIGEGFHAKLGEAHAEVNAIKSVSDKSLLSKSTLYVTLEPCSHHGKTPPCVDLILKHEIPRVFISNQDPFGEVDGKGIKALEKNGVEVSVGLLKDQGVLLNKRFFTFHLKKRPYIILKWAETADGFISRIKENIGPNNNWISNSISRQLVHQWRAEEQAILVGRKTVETDDPKLDCREFEGNNPIRIILDPHLKLKKSFQVFNDTSKTYILNKEKNLQKNNIEYVKIDFDKHFNSSLNKFCYQNEIQSMIIEGGRHTLNQFIKGDNWDECRIFRSNKVFNSGIESPSIKGVLKSSHKIKEDLLSIYLRKV